MEGLIFHAVSCSGATKSGDKAKGPTQPMTIKDFRKYHFPLSSLVGERLT